MPALLPKRNLHCSLLDHYLAEPREIWNPQNHAWHRCSLRPHQPQEPAQKLWLLACFFFICLFCSFHSLSRTKVPRSSYELLKSARHLTRLHKRFHIALNGSRPGASSIQRDRCSVNNFQMLSAAMLRREASLGCISNSGQPTDMHAPCPAAKPTSCPVLLPRWEQGKQCNLASRHATEQAVPLSSLSGLFWAALIDTPWQHGNKGPAKKALNVLQKLLEKSATQTCFHKKSGCGMIGLLLLDRYHFTMYELRVMKLYFVNLLVWLVFFFSCPNLVVLRGMPLKVQHVDQLASKQHAT